ncbi:hypothetical protein FLL45_08535 [Aliikangiella marina]|uniref:DUF1302 domain-containing protein n=1 Tax=Aliikangiella marina TaxID=1712262 RepID=A0A545TCP4_9GAMM|nr:hypothetical protein [Aliikangiella marina]TQV74979.1 hypothetical protein FLL45_08535 [Aliikangiella marina]
MAKLLKIVSWLLLASWLPKALAVDFNGELKFQSLAAKTDTSSALALSGAQDYHLNQFNFRGLIDFQKANWAVDLDYLLVAENSTDIALLSAPSMSPPSQLFWDLEKHLSASDPTYIQHAIDRVNVKYSSENWVFKIGRQALTWGNGVVFQPLDLFNPFSPDAKDTSYKPGIDAIYYQYLFSDGADLQLLWVPRKNQVGQRESDLDSFALKYLFFADEIQAEILIAEDYQDKTYGIGLVGPLGEAIWKFDLVSQEFEQDEFWSFDLNIQYSWQWFDRPVSGHIEYYQNGFADRRATTLESLSPALLDRLQKGQIFSVAKKNLTMGVQIQLEALWTLSTNLIYELDQDSHLLLTNLIFNSSDVSNLLFGLQVKSGEKGSQYGGIFLTNNRQVIADSGNQLFIRYEYYY